MANPAFGSPAWDAKYHIKRFKKGQNHRGKAAKKGSGNFIAGAIKHPGKLHRDLGVPQGKKIPPYLLAEAAKRKGKVGREARLAQTLGKLNHG